MKTRIALRLLCVALLILPCRALWSSSPPARSTERPRVVVSTDIGGTDPDDFQSMAHLLLYADALDIEGLVSSPYGPGRARHIHEVIDVYERDFPALRTRSEAYPAPAQLRAVTKQGQLESAGAAGFTTPTEGSEWIARCARKPDARPLWVLVWGGLDDLAQALHDAPDILPKLRVYFIGGPNKMWSIDAYNHIDRAHPGLWIIEANATYRGWFTGGNQAGEWGNTAFVAARVAGRGALGNYFATHLRGAIKMGDTPSVMHVLGAAPEDPARDGWGGRFVRVWEGRNTEFSRLTTAQDQVEVFGTVEWTLALPPGTPPGAKATMLVDGRIPVSARNNGRALRFRFSPRDAKVWPFAITSEAPELNGLKGAFTAAPPPVERTLVASARRPNWWIDDPAPEAAEGVHSGAKHVNRWREEFLRDFAERMARCGTAASTPANAPEPAFASARAASPDIVVYSGVPCGIAAAVTAAREGAKALLIEPTRHVGGLSTSGINTAESEHMLKWTIGGFADEFYQRLGRHYGTGRPEYFFESSVAEKVYLAMLKEAGVEVRYGASVDMVAKDGAAITGITLTDGSKLEARVFVDASYEGDLMARAGVNYAVGRESKAEFGEEAAGVRFDKTPRKARTVDANGRLLPGISAWAKDLKEGGAHRAPMNYNFRLTVAKDPKLMAPIPAPKRYDAARYSLLADWLRDQTAQKRPVKLEDILDLYPRRNGKFELNNKQSAIFSLGHFGGQFDWADGSYEQRARIYEDHLDYTLGLLRFLASDPSVPASVQGEMKALGLHKDEFADNGNLPFQLYVREARRMRGEHVMTQRDAQTERRKPDSIGMSSHFIDSHHVQRVALNDNQFVNEGRIWRMGFAYQIPYRALTPSPAQCANLLVPGAASYTHVAFCTLRLESVWMITGHAAGLAAAMAAKESGDVHKVSVPALQDKLRAQRQIIDFIPGQPEKCERLNGPPEF